MESHILIGVVLDKTTGNPINAARVSQNGTKDDVPVFANNAGQFELLISENGKRSINLQADGYKPMNSIFYKNDKLQEFALEPLPELPKETPTPKLVSKPKQATVLPPPRPTKAKRDILEYILVGLSVIMVLVAIYVFYKLVFSKPNENNSLPAVENQSNTPNRTEISSKPTVSTSEIPTVKPSIDKGLPTPTPKIIEI